MRALIGFSMFSGPTGGQIPGCAAEGEVGRIMGTIVANLPRFTKWLALARMGEDDQSLLLILTAIRLPNAHQGPVLAG